MSNSLSEEQYKILCQACDRVLLRPDTTIERMAISWLHIMREHPVFLENYYDLFFKNKWYEQYLKNWKRRFFNWAGWLRQLARLVFIEKTWQTNKNHKLPGVDVLFVSHLINEAHAGQPDDFYFGDITDKLEADKISSLVAMINHTSRPGKKLSALWKSNAVQRVVLSSSLKLLDELKLYIRLKRESRQLKQLSKKEEAGISRDILKISAEEAMASSTHTSLRIAVQIFNLVKQTKPKVIIITHEGHAWERVVFAAARTAQADIKCVGYLHSAIFREQHAVRRCLARQYNPDEILTAGSVTCEQLKKTPGLMKIPVSVLGSKRSSNQEEKNKNILAGREGSRLALRSVCLVLPEGIMSECTILFDYSLICAKKLPHIKFIWRLHPLLSFKSLVANNPEYQNLPENIILSENSFEEDLELSYWALYRGTTAIIQAVNAGLRPMYLRKPGEMTIDPLYELTEWRTIIENKQDFIETIDPDRDEVNQDAAGAQDAKNYCQEYFQPLNYNKITEIIGK